MSEVLVLVIVTNIYFTIFIIVNVILILGLRLSTVTENQDGRINYYPNCDPTIWLRSCEKEIRQPLHGTKSG